MTAPTVLALDLSLSGSGVALPDGTVETLRPPKGLTGEARLDWIWTKVIEALGFGITLDNPLVAVEGYAFGRANQAHQIGELGGVIRHGLWKLGIPFIEVAPTQVKKYATGKGNASKAEVLTAAVRRLGYEGSDDNQSDALWLRALVLDALGHPVVDVPAKNREALAAVTLPGQAAA